MALATLTWSCNSPSDSYFLDPPAEIRGRVDEPIRAFFPVQNGGGSGLRYAFSVNAQLPRIRSLATLRRSSQGVYFEWSPVIGHEGTHVFQFELLSGDDLIDTIDVPFTIATSSRFTPTVLAPSTCVHRILGNSVCPIQFTVSVRDEDELPGNVDLMINPPPLGEWALTRVENSKVWRFSWTPSFAAISQSTTPSYELRFRATDGEHVVEFVHHAIFEPATSCAGPPSCP